MTSTRSHRWIAGTLLVGIAVGIAWWTLARSVDQPLEPDWASTVVTIAGDGTAAVRNGDAGRARFSEPFGIAVAADRSVYVADAGDAGQVRVISPAGIVSTVATGFSSPSGIAIDANGFLYVADTGNDAVKRISPQGQVSILATGLNGPMAVAVDATGRVLVADTYNDRVGVLDADGVLHALGDEGLFDTPCGVAVDPSGRVYVADTGHDVVRVISPDGGVSTIDLHAGGGRPIGIAVSESGHVYVTDERGRVLEIAPDGAVRIVAGSAPGFRDGDGRDARFRRPAGLAVLGPGRLVVADAGNALVRLIEATSQREARQPASPLIAPRFDAEAFGWQPLLWPVAPMDGPFEIAGTHGEARGGEGADRFHAGVDIRVDDGTPVRAVRDGTVRSPLSAGDFQSMNEWLRIGDVAYVHIRAGRLAAGALLDHTRFVATSDDMGRLSRIRVKRGARFLAGEVIGSVNAFNHVHLNVGWAGEEVNPLRFRIPQFEDAIPPTIPPNGITLYDSDGQILRKREGGRLVVSGHVQVVVDAWDQVNGNRLGRRLGLYELGYQVLSSNGAPAPPFDSPRATIRFDRLAADDSAPRLVYAPGSGIPFYGRRLTRFLYVVTNTYRDGQAAPGVWDTTRLRPGDYTLRVRAADVRGNEAAANRDVPVRIVAP